MHHLMQKKLPGALQVLHINHLACVTMGQLLLVGLKLSGQGVEGKERRAQSDVVVVSEPAINGPCIAADGLPVFLDIAPVLRVLTGGGYVTVACDFERGGAAEVVWRNGLVSWFFARRLHLPGWRVHEASDA